MIWVEMFLKFPAISRSNMDILLLLFQFMFAFVKLFLASLQNLYAIHMLYAADMKNIRHPPSAAQYLFMQEIGHSQINGDVCMLDIVAHLMKLTVHIQYDWLLCSP